MRRVRQAISGFGRDLKGTAATLWNDRSAQVVVLIFLLPWVVAVAVHRNLNVLTPLGQIAALIAIYWFFSRRIAYGNLPVLRPFLETVAVIIFVAAWIVYRVAEYLRWIVLPPITLTCCGNMTDTVIPKIIEMFLLPLGFFLFLRYSFSRLGLGLPVRAWLPALLPLLYLVQEGLNHHGAETLLNRTFTFYLAAGLPEEFLFRGLVQSRLESFTGRPIWGLLLGAFVFGLSHLPIDLYGSGIAHWQSAVENAFTFQMGVGFGLGFAFQRTRNLWPLTLIHALIDSAPLVLI